MINVKFSSQCYCIIPHQIYYVSHQAHDLVRFDELLWYYFWSNVGDLVSLGFGSFQNCSQTKELPNSFSKSSNKKSPQISPSHALDMNAESLMKDVAREAHWEGNFTLNTSYSYSYWESKCRKDWKSPYYWGLHILVYLQVTKKLHVTSYNLDATSYVLVTSSIS